MIRSLALCALLLLVLGGPAFGLGVEAVLDRGTARVGDQVVLTVVVEGGLRNVPEPKLPEFGDDFEVYSGGTSRNFSFVNGKMSSSLTVRYVLIPQHEGTFRIGPIEVEGEGEVVRAEPLELIVTAASVPPTPAPGSPTEAGSIKGNADIFVRATVDKTSPYLYEQVTYRVRLYTRASLMENPGFSPPATQGFWKEELPARQPSIEVVDGKQYRVLEVAIAVFPTTPGPLTIGESVLECSVQGERSQRDPLSFFSGPLFESRRVVLRTDPLTLDVMPLPPGAPPDFQGAVGEYELQVSPDRTEVTQDEPITLSVTITGQGNLRTLGDVVLPSTPEFRAYPSETKQTVTRNRGTIGGTLARQFVLVPLSVGEKVIPPVELVAFSPRAGTYKKLTAPPIAATVIPGGGVAGVPRGRSDIEVLGRDIRFIETEVPAFISAQSAWQGARKWVLMVPLPVLGYAAVWLYERRRRRLGSDGAMLRRGRAAREAREILKRGRGGSEEEVTAHAGEAVRAYLADRYDLPRAGLTPDMIQGPLREEGLDPRPVAEFLEEADAARYAPGVEAVSGDWLEEARLLIERLERSR